MWQCSKNVTNQESSPKLKHLGCHYGSFAGTWLMTSSSTWLDWISLALAVTLLTGSRWCPAACPDAHEGHGSQLIEAAGQLSWPSCGQASIWASEYTKVDHVSQWILKGFPQSWSNETSSISELLKPLKQYPHNILLHVGGSYDKIKWPSSYPGVLMLFGY